MISYMTFLVGAGQLPDSGMSSFSNALSKVWGGSLLKYSARDDPTKILGCLLKKKGLVQLLGDPAKTQISGMNWLEALGAWRQPSVLVVYASSDGISGNALAYTALCRELSVPLLGLVQYGGEWEAEIRKLDGLPWCGWIPEEKSDALEYNNLINNRILTEQVVVNLNRRFNSINL